MPERLATRLQSLLPALLLTRLAGRLAASTYRPLAQWLIMRFLARYAVDLSEAQPDSPQEYRSFNEFFTRPLRPGARVLADSRWICPVDGTVSQAGRIDGNQMIQAKGQTYSTLALLGGDAAMAAQVYDGSFCTLYLSPKDYHRVHMPHAGHLRRMLHVPGTLFSVNPASARHIPGLFARNERLVCEFDSTDGPFILVLVGATIVGSMATIWHGTVNPPRARRVREWRYDAHDIALAPGEEMGRFQLGSTVILLRPPGGPAFPHDWREGRAVRLGEAMSTD